MHTVCRTCENTINLDDGTMKEVEKEDEYGVETYEVCMNCGDYWAKD